MPALAHSIRRRRHRKRRRQAKARRTVWQTSLFVVLPLALLATPLLSLFTLSIWLYFNALSLMPTPQQTMLNDSAHAVRFSDRHGAALLGYSDDPSAGFRRWLSLDELPLHLVAASRLVNARDYGAVQTAFDPLDTLARLSSYILGLPVAADDSLAGQLVRHSALPATPSSDMDSRLLEIVFSAESKRTLKTDQLLEWQLNSQAYGSGILGVEAAAQLLLGKSAAALTPPEAALLTVLGAEPTLDPRADLPALRSRAGDLLSDLREAGQLDAADANAEALESLELSDSPRLSDGLAADFLAYARAQALQILDRQGLEGRRLLASGGLSIRTSLDLSLQQRAAESAESLVLLDAATGEILSLVGDAAAVHQPAGILAPFVYMDAFASRTATPASMLYDILREYPGAGGDLVYKPANPDGTQRGPLNLRDAMAAGLLPPVIQVAAERGLQGAIQLAGALGFTSLDAGHDDLRLLEGGGAASVLDAAYAYSVLASMGVMHGTPTVPASLGMRGRDPVAVLRIEDAGGQELWRYRPAGGQSVIVEPSLAYLVNDILADDEARERMLERADPPLPARRTAWVTSSSADSRDHWTLAYSPDLVLAVHGQRIHSAEELGALLEWAHQQRDLPERDWRAPADIEEYLVCELSGMLPTTTDHCPTRLEIMPAGSQLLADDRWQQVEINSATGQPATVNTPEDLRATKAYFVPPDEIRAWWQENGLPLPPTGHIAADGTSVSKPAQLLAPADFAYVGATVDIQGKISRPGALGWTLDYGADVNPDSWTTIVASQRLERDGELRASWGTAQLSGIHTLRLTVDFADGSQEQDTRLLTFDNTPPAISLGAGEEFIRLGETVTLVADARDNLAIERVEFYRGGELLGVDRDWRYTHEATVLGLGQETFRALVFDQVGNRAAAELVVSVVAG